MPATIPTADGPVGPIAFVPAETVAGVCKDVVGVCDSVRGGVEVRLSFCVVLFVKKWCPYVGQRKTVPRPLLYSVRRSPCVLLLPSHSLLVRHALPPKGPYTYPRQDAVLVSTLC